MAIQTLDKALEIKVQILMSVIVWKCISLACFIPQRYFCLVQPRHEEALADRETASHLVRRRKQRNSTDLNIDPIRYKVRDKVEDSGAPILIEDGVDDS